MYGPDNHEILLQFKIWMGKPLFGYLVLKFVKVATHIKISPLTLTLISSRLEQLQNMFPYCVAQKSNCSAGIWSPAKSNMAKREEHETNSCKNRNYMVRKFTCNVVLKLKRNTDSIMVRSIAIDVE